MNTVTLDVASIEAVKRRTLQAFRGHAQGARISFATPELLWKTLTAKRWALLKLMTGAGALSLREVARRSGRDVKGVHTDVHALLNAGVLRKTGDGRIEFPYDGVRVEFELNAAA